ncbi:MAG: hypothetical protein EXS24_03065 [Pedosphaera sp.]|nr:hypothetical protein [Pedosphaera sp.]
MRLDFLVIIVLALVACGGNTPSPKVVTSKYGKPTVDALKIFGEGGDWSESQELIGADGKMRTVAARSKARWIMNGHGLLNELVATVDGRTESSLWVKSYDEESKVYRYTYFWPDGRVDNFEGALNADGSLLRWTAILMPGVTTKLSIVIFEKVPVRARREWEFEISEDGKPLVKGRGTGVRD